MLVTRAGTTPSRPGGAFAMDRFALGIIAAGLCLVATLVVSVLAQPANSAVPGYAAVAASFAGLAIIAGLTVLERRTGSGPRPRG